jgi:hypothetical protein
MIKDVPYFPFYAANMMSSRSFRLMSLKERGLLITILMECWVNGSVPSEPSDMAKILGLTIDEVRIAYSNLQSAFLESREGQLISTELEGYRKNFLDKREKQRLGGIKGAANKKELHGRSPKGQPTTQPKGSLIQINSNSFKSNQLTRKELTNEEFDAWLDGVPAAANVTNGYLRAKG